MVRSLRCSRSTNLIDFDGAATAKVMSRLEDAKLGGRLLFQLRPVWHVLVPYSLLSVLLLGSHCRCSLTCALARVGQCASVLICCNLAAAWGT